MIKSQYTPSFLVSTEVPEELYEQLNNFAAAKGLSEEQVYRKALKFFVARCVHTQGRRKRTGN